MLLSLFRPPVLRLLLVLPFIALVQVALVQAEGEPLESDWLVDEGLGGWGRHQLDLPGVTTGWKGSHKVVAQGE